MYTPSGSPWGWMRSNVCWCSGNTGGTTTFDSAGGDNIMMQVGNGCRAQAIVLPIDIATLEKSNMQYSFFREWATDMISRSASGAIAEQPIFSILVTSLAETTAWNRARRPMVESCELLMRAEQEVLPWRQEFRVQGVSNQPSASRRENASDQYQ